MLAGGQEEGGEGLHFSSGSMHLDGGGGGRTVSVVDGDDDGVGAIAMQSTPDHQVIDLMQREVHVLQHHPSYDDKAMSEKEDEDKEMMFT